MQINIEDIKITATKEEKNFGMFSIEPLPTGFGATLGNALRRVLMTSIKGAAVTQVKITGVSHQFTTIPGVKEDVVEMILNIKKLRFKVYSDEPVLVNLSTKGEKVVTGADIEKNSNVEVVNPEQTICTLTSKNADISIEFKVRRGFGYITVEEREKEIQNKERGIRDKETLVAGKKEEYENDKDKIISKLEKIAQMTKDEARKFLLTAWEDKLKGDVAKQIRERPVINGCKRGQCHAGLRL